MKKLIKNILKEELSKKEIELAINSLDRVGPPYFKLLDDYGFSLNEIEEVLSLYFNTDDIIIEKKTVTVSKYSGYKI
jgi:hypothetical protein